MKKLKVGLIGYGSGGRIFHEPLTLKEFISAEILKANMGIIRWFTKIYMMPYAEAACSI